MKKTTIVALLLLMLIPITASAQESAQSPAALCAAAIPAEDPETREFEQAEEVLQEGVDYQAILCTSAGPIYVDLYEEQTPITVNNFVFLAQQGYFNNTNFHRVITDFMAQAGDPTNTGTSGPGYQFEDEIVDELVFDRPGLLAMANSGPATNGSQFFITTVPTDWLNGGHTIFGEVLTGQQVVENIRPRDPQFASDKGEALHTVLIVENPDDVLTDEPVFTAPTLEDAEASVETLAETVPALLEGYFPGISAAVKFELSEAEVLSTDEVQSSASEANQDAASTYYGSHNHQYTIYTASTNTECQLADFLIQEVSYQADVYGSAEDATAAFEDERLTQMLQNDGFEALADPTVPFALYTRTIEGCAGGDMTEVVGVYQKGFGVMTARAVIPVENADIAGPAIVEFVKPFYEEVLFSALQPRIEG